MVLFRNGEMFRLKSSPLFSFLIPSISASRPPIKMLRRRQLASDRTDKIYRQHFSATTSNRAEASAAAAAPEPEDEESEDPLAGLSSLEPKGSPSNATNPSSRAPTTQNGRSRFEDILSTRADRISASSTSSFRDMFSRPRQQGSDGLKPGEIARSMQMPGLRGSSSPGQDMASKAIAASEPPARRNKHTIRSRPSVGRTIEVEPKAGVDLGQALRKLGILIAVNKVRHEQKMQRYHERPGLRRKRVKSERYRKRFMESFNAAVSRVKDMKRQGW